MATLGEDTAVEGHVLGVFRQGAMTMGTRIAIVLVNIPTSILVARILGTEGQGAYASAVTFPTIFAFVGLLGIDASHTYLLSKRQYSIAQINGQGALLTIILSAIATPAYLLFLRIYEGAAQPELGYVLRLGALLIPVLMAKFLSVALLLGLQSIRWFNLANLIQAGSLLVLMCANFAVFHGGVTGALIGYLLSEITVTVVALRTARKIAGTGRLIERPPPGLFKRSAIYAMKGHIGNVLVHMMYRYDMFLVLSLAGLGAQGLYSIAAMTAEKLTHISQSAQIVLFPRLSSLTAEHANELTPRVARNSFLLTVAAAVVLYLLSRFVLLVFYGDQYLPALRAFRILIPGITMLSFSTILSGDFSARDKRIYHTIANAIGFVINISLCLTLIPRIGIEGAAWASTVAYTTQSLVMLALFRKVSGRSLAETVFAKREDLSLYMALVRKAVLRTSNRR